MNNRITLRILLVITMVWGGLSAFAYLVTAVMLPTMRTLYEQNPMALPDEFSVMMQSMFEVPRGFYAASGILFILEVVGAAGMWRLRWSGFHCYTLARLLLLLLPALFLGRAFVGVGDIMMAVLFIALYYMLLRRLGATHRNQVAEAVPDEEQTPPQEENQE